MSEVVEGLAPKGAAPKVDEHTQELGRKILQDLALKAGSGNDRTSKPTEEGEGKKSDSDDPTPMRLKREMEEKAREGRDEQGRYKAKDEEQPEPEASDDKKGKPKKREVTAEQAKNFLKLKGVPEKAMEGMDDDELVAWRSNLIGQDRSHHQAVEEVNSLKAEIEQLKEAATAREPGKQDGASPRLEDLDERFKPLIDSGDISEDAAKTLADALKTQSKTFEDRLEAMNKRLTAADGMEEARLLESARAELRERFPGLDDPDQRAAVYADMKGLASSFQDVAKTEGIPAATAQLMEKAARANGLDEVDPAEEARLAEERRQERAAGQPTTDSRTGEPKGDPAAEEMRKNRDILRKHWSPSRGWKGVG